MDITDRKSLPKNCRSVTILPKPITFRSFETDLEQTRGRCTAILPNGQIRIYISMFDKTGTFSHTSKNDRRWTLGEVLWRIYDNVKIMSRWDVAINHHHYDSVCQDGSEFYNNKSLPNFYVDGRDIYVEL